MNDTPELYVSTFKVPANMLLSWRAAVELVFAERDLKAVPRAGLDGVVQHVLGRRWRAEPVEYVYLIAPPRDIRARLSVHGYTEQHCRSECRLINSKSPPRRIAATGASFSTRTAPSSWRSAERHFRRPCPFCARSLPKSAARCSTVWEASAIPDS
ncbi:hypothetical protein [Sphingomonas profundi]|uniref:hypothetical protein n=1 Tax=Alterirhizorhabdus profundi TaxID=2681549 RepID=UPI0012E73077|nr:hypothetical protein [Sphingomonas profundi]